MAKSASVKAVRAYTHSMQEMGGRRAAGTAVRKYASKGHPQRTKVATMLKARRRLAKKHFGDSRLSSVKKLGN